MSSKLSNKRKRESEPVAAAAAAAAAAAEQSDASSESEDEDSPPPASEGRQVYIILDGAQLETVKTKRGDFQLMNCDDHVNIMKRHGKDPQKFRPDIVHQELMAVLDSPLNKAGKVKVFMHTAKNVLVEINPKTRIPRTFKRFSGLMGKW
jgi:rRNA small subunit pseudouridine methyltransferase Nep1